MDSEHRPVFRPRPTLPATPGILRQSKKSSNPSGTPIHHQTTGICLNCDRAKGVARRLVYHVCLSCEAQGIGVCAAIVSPLANTTRSHWIEQSANAVVENE